MCIAPEAGLRHKQCSNWPWISVVPSCWHLGVWTHVSLAVGLDPVSSGSRLLQMLHSPRHTHIPGSQATSPTCWLIQLEVCWRSHTDLCTLTCPSLTPVVWTTDTWSNFSCWHLISLTPFSPVFGTQSNRLSDLWSHFIWWHPDPQSLQDTQASRGPLSSCWLLDLHIHVCW